jgi:hypothetical protein
MALGDLQLLLLQLQGSSGVNGDRRVNPELLSVRPGYLAIRPRDLLGCV